MNTVNIDICMCTFRRPQIVDTLQSITKLELKPEWKLRVVVADNDETPSAKELVESTARETSLSVLYIHAPARNISVARNACLEAATAPFIAFIDDDEVVTPGWLAAMMEKIQSTNCDAVLGPVHAIYLDDCPKWISKGDFHSSFPILNEKNTFSGWSTGNVFLRRISPSVQPLRFRTELGKSGGEDTLYFAAIEKAGGRIEFAPDALITEIVPKNRATFKWLMRRRFRSGQTHAVLLLELNIDGIPGYMRNVALASAKLIYCAAAALLNLFGPDRMRYWLLRGTLHAGVVSRLFGKSEIVQYGQKEKTSCL
jgi:succinoglycan biosynthesis protein ExoM